MSKIDETMNQARVIVMKAQALLAEGDGELSQEKATEFDGLMKQADELKARADRLQLVETRARELGSVETKTPAPSEDKTFEPVYVMRFGEENKAKQVIMADLVGPNYRQVVADQSAAFAKYLRWGDRMLESGDVKLLRQQIFPWDQVETLVKAGMSIGEVKTTMIEAQGTLGGYAVPPAVQQAIATRLPGLTVIRGGGATVVNLIQNNSIDVPLYTGGNTRYVGALRGLWGAETQAPTEDNATLGMTSIVAHVYTYKVSFSQSLVEDAANLVDLVQRDIATTLAIDEDDAFLIGDGVGKPLGIIPGSANALSLSTANSGNGTALTSDGLKALRRGVPSQYRNACTWIGNNATMLAIEKLKDGNGAYLYGELSSGGNLMGRPARESEAMPDIAASAFPLIFGDLGTYYIVEKAGLTIARFQDSNTGINKVEYHVRKRVGGRVVETWRLCLQYVSA